MSFAYANMHNFGQVSKNVNQIRVYSDTKITLPPTSQLKWNTLTEAAVREYGICKTHIYQHRYCISFAGNDIRRASELFMAIERDGCESFDFLVELALNIHVNSESEDDIEFILCAAENDCGLSEIACVKEGEQRRNCESAWIGSYEAFRVLQGARLCGEKYEKNASITIEQFFDAVHSCNDETVGGQVIVASTIGGRFEYGYCFYSAAERIQHVPSGETVSLVHSAKEGGFTIEIYERDNEPVMSFYQIGKSLLYSKRIRYAGASDIESTMNAFLLPILFETETEKALKPGAE